MAVILAAYLRCAVNRVSCAVSCCACGCVRSRETGVRWDGKRCGDELECASRSRRSRPLKGGLTALGGASRLRFRTWAHTQAVRRRSWHTSRTAHTLPPREICASRTGTISRTLSSAVERRSVHLVTIVVITASHTELQNVPYTLECAASVMPRAVMQPPTSSSSADRRASARDIFDVAALPIGTLRRCYLTSSATDAYLTCCDRSAAGGCFTSRTRIPRGLWTGSAQGGARGPCQSRAR